MSVVILHKPNDIDFIGNGLKYRVQGNNYIITDTCKGKFAFRKVGVLNDGEIFILPIPGEEANIQITAKTVPVLPNQVTAGALIAITAAEMNLIPEVVKYYTVWVDVNKLYFEYREPARLVALQLGFTGAGYEDYTVDPLLLESVCGAKTVEPDYYITAFVEFQNEFLATLKGDVDADGITEFSFGKLFPKNLFDIGTVVTAYSANSVLLGTTVRFSEHYQNEDWPFTLDDLTAIFPGKIAYNDYPDYVQETGFLSSQKKIQTHNKAFHKFAFFNGTGNASVFKFSVKLFHVDGNTEIIEVYSDAVTSNQIYFADLLISELLSGKPETYRINLFTSVSEERIAIYLTNKSYRSKQFAFVNSFGFYEVLTFEAFSQEELVVDKTISKKYVSADYESIQGEYGSRVTSSHNEFACSSGAKTDLEAKQVQEFLISEYVYEIIDNKYQKVEIKSEGSQIIDQEKGIQEISFTYINSYDN